MVRISPLAAVVAGTLALLAGAPMAHADEPSPEVAAPPAPALPQLTVRASFFSRYELRDNYDVIGASRGRFLESDGVAYRARLGLATTAVDIGNDRTVAVALVPQASGFWADSGSTLSDDGLDVHEAYVRLAAPSMRVDVGRFEMAYGDHVVIGDVGWHETGRSFDGARVRVEPGEAGAWIDVFATQLGEGRAANVTAMGTGDWLFFGAYGAAGPALAEGMDLDVYVFGELWPTAAGMDGPIDRAVELTGGARLEQRRGVVDYRAESGVQVGQRPGEGAARDAFGFHADAEVGAHLASDALRVAVGGFYASGDDPDTERDESWNQLFPTAHKFMGFADIIGGRSNITGGIARVKYKLSPALELAADGHVFFRPHGAAGDLAYTGSEIDAGAVYVIGKGLKLRGGYSLFIPAESQYGSDALASFGEVELRYDLK